VACASLPWVLPGNSGAAGEWWVCVNEHCRMLSDIFERPIGANVTIMRVGEP
jgi:hypothetical protein